MLTFLTTERLKTLIPYIFLLIILGFIGKLGYDNNVLAARNERLRDANTSLSSKNNDLAATLNNLADKVGEQNEIVKTESRRRAAAEMKSQRSQEEVVRVLKESKCAAEPVPDTAAGRLRSAADGARSGQAALSADTGQSTD